jgi:CRISPR/Cas system CSM-associated protein Csm3 (group 7 of RAMP superfamily)
MTTAKTPYELPVHIELLSDMCCGTGENAGTHLGQMTATDSFGLPIIPGKRLKGLMRECAKALTDNGYLGDDGNAALCELFGGLRGKRGKLVVSTAELTDAEAYKAGLQASSATYLPGQVTEVFTATRSHTAIDAESGVALNHSLRTNQVVHRCVGGKNLSFDFSLKVLDPSDDEKKLLGATLKTLRHIGLNKARGYGEARCVPGGWQAQTKLDFSRIEYAASGETATAPYTITLEQDVVMSSRESLDYFSGSVLMGALARYASEQKWFKDVILQGTIFSNAYPVAFTAAGEQLACYPLPASFQLEKNAGVGKGAPALVAYNQAEGFKQERDSGQEESHQYVSIDGCGNWDGDKLIRVEVEKAYSFHNATVGSAQGKQYYSLRTFKAGQVFSGTITADTGALNVLRELVEQLGGYIKLGASASAQFGGCRLALGADGAEDTGFDTPVRLEGNVVAECLSDVIIVDDWGRNSVEADALSAELGKVLGIDISDVKVFSRAITTGGYNAQWGLHRRQFLAFQKGTCLLLPECVAKELPSAYLRLGLQTNEGYGLVRLRNARALNAGLTISRDSCMADPSSTSDGAPKASKEAFEWLRKMLLLNAAKAGVATLAASTDTSEFPEKVSTSSAMRVLAAWQAVLRGETDDSLPQDSAAESSAVENGADNLSPENDAGGLLAAFEAKTKKMFPDEKKDKALKEICQKHIVRAFCNWRDGFVGADSFDQEDLDALFQAYMEGFIRVLKLWKAKDDTKPSQDKGGDDDE